MLELSLLVFVYSSCSRYQMQIVDVYCGQNAIFIQQEQKSFPFYSHLIMLSYVDLVLHCEAKPRKKSIIVFPHLCLQLFVSEFPACAQSWVGVQFSQKLLCISFCHIQRSILFGMKNWCRSQNTSKYCIAASLQTFSWGNSKSVSYLATFETNGLQTLQLSLFSLLIYQTTLRQ